MKKSHLHILRLIVALALGLPGSGVWAQSQPVKPEDALYLHKGDTVLFLGDQNITSKFYQQIYVEEMKSRYPELVMRDGVVVKSMDGPNLKFNCGSVESESVDLGLSSIDERLLTYKPTVAVLCYGQSDWTQDPEKFAASLRKMVRALRKANVEVLLMTSPTITKADNPKNRGSDAVAHFTTPKLAAPGRVAGSTTLPHSAG